MKKIETLIADNFPVLMEYVGEGNVDIFIDTLYKQDSMKPFFEKEETIKYILDNTRHYDFDDIIRGSTIKEKAQKFIHNNFDYVLKNYSIKKIVHLFKYMKLDEKEKVKIDEYFNTKKQEFLSETITRIFSYRGGIDKEQLSTLLGIVNKVVDNILEKENCKMVDIEILTSGSYSNVLKIGEKIIKAGIPRKTFKIPNDKRILQPYLRRDLSEELGINATIEVSDRVDTGISLNRDELYEIYREMRDRGIVCGDFHIGNIGRLIKPNIPRNEVLNGMIGNVNETLNPGEYVILDTDFIYKEDDPNLVLSAEESKIFESRYKNEQVIKTMR